MSPGNKADQDANRIQSMGKQERGQAFLKKCLTEIRGQMSNDDPAFCRLISMLEFQFAVDRTKKSDYWKTLWN